MNAVVVIPWWPGTDDPVRYRWRDQVVVLWASRGYPVEFGVGFEGAARNRGIEAAIERYSPEVVICTDADAIITARAAAEAVELARSRPGLVVPHDRYVYLAESACVALTAELADLILAKRGGRWPVHNGWEIESLGDLSVGGPTVFSVDTWREAGGYDENLTRAYDAAFALACGTLVAEQRRVAGDFVHLWHERPPETQEAWATLGRYHAAAESGQDAMRALIEERRP